MHQTRQDTPIRIPLPRKGSKYVVRAASHINSSVPVLIALRNMLGLAKTAKEAEEMIKEKAIKINGRVVERVNESILLFHILDAGKKYQMNLSPTGKFFFEETKKDVRICKVIGKKVLGKGKIQINMNDGTNMISKDKINMGDSIYIDSAGKVQKKVSMEPGKEALIFSGKYQGQNCTIKSLKEGKATISIKGKEELITLNASQLIVL